MGRPAPALSKQRRRQYLKVVTTRHRRHVSVGNTTAVGYFFQRDTQLLIKVSYCYCARLAGRHRGFHRPPVKIRYEHRSTFFVVSKLRINSMFRPHRGSGSASASHGETHFQKGSQAYKPGRDQRVGSPLLSWLACVQARSSPTRFFRTKGEIASQSQSYVLFPSRRKTRRARKSVSVSKSSQSSRKRKGNKSTQEINQARRSDFKSTNDLNQDPLLNPDQRGSDSLKKLRCESDTEAEARCDCLAPAPWLLLPPEDRSGAAANQAPKDPPDVSMSASTSASPASSTLAIGPPVPRPSTRQALEFLPPARCPAPAPVPEPSKPKSPRSSPFSLLQNPPALRDIHPESTFTSSGLCHVHCSMVLRESLRPAVSPASLLVRLVSDEARDRRLRMPWPEPPGPANTLMAVSEEIEDSKSLEAEIQPAPAPVPALKLDIRLAYPPEPEAAEL